MNWYKKAQSNMYGQPLDFKEKVEAPMYQSLLDDSNMEWYSPKAEDYVKGPTKDYYSEMKNIKGNVVYMSPDEYINECVTGARQGYIEDGIDKPFNELKEEIIKWRRVSTTDDGGSRIESYKDRWFSGEEPHMGYIIYNNGKYYGQEGMHRALMAKDLGVKTIPVLIVNKNTNKTSSVKTSSAINQIPPNATDVWESETGREARGQAPCPECGTTCKVTACADVGGTWWHCPKCGLVDN